MINYRIANKKDVENIARLHTINWQQYYYKALSSNYLNKEAASERLILWKARLENSNPNQHVILAEENNQLIGFACTFLKKDPIYGALLDNLHVYKKHQGKGIGKELMKRSVNWVYGKGPTSKYYLWVLAINKPAYQFYIKLGGEERETVSYKMPDGNHADAIRIVWNDLNLLNF